ncbi:MAG: cupredoxin domain-containing protein [Actinomycetota bacterium]
MSREVRRRLVLGLGIPAAAVLLGAALVFSFSRLLLAAPEELAPFIALLVAANILVGGALAAMLRSRWAYVLLATVIVGTIVGGGVVGAVVGERAIERLVEEEAPPEGPPGAPTPSPEQPPPGGEEEKPGPKAPAPATQVEISAKNISFSTDLLSFLAGKQITIRFRNDDASIPHNVAIYTDESGQSSIFVGEIITGVAEAEYSFAAPEPGSYFFRCDVHPTTMFGTVTVE